jgi:NADH dehydrogenase FAD-containing subunit
MGVQVLLDDRLNLDEHDTQIGWKGESRTLVTTSGKAIQSDVQLFTVGNHAFNTRMVESLGKEVLDEHGRVCVSPTLQLESFLHIFAAGDVANLDESTTAYAARQQAEIAAQNVYALIMGNKLQKASPAPKIAAVPLGRKRGSTLLPFGILGDWFTSRVKGSDMFLTKHNAFPN